MKNAYIVVEPEQIVALDLAHAIKAYDPHAEVRLFAGIDEALAALADDPPQAIFLHDEPGRFLGSAAGRTISGMGVPLAFTGTLATARPEGAEVLASPFSDITVARVLRRLKGLSVQDQG